MPINFRLFRPLEEALRGIKQEPSILHVKRHQLSSRSSEIRKLMNSATDSVIVIAVNK